MDYSATVDQYIEKNVTWEAALKYLRNIIKETGLKETVKWGMPVYCRNNKNIVGIGAFKSYVGLWFYQGALLNDPHKLLINAQEGVTKALRQIRYASVDDINSDVLKQYILEAIENQKKGKEIKPNTSKPLIIPGELKKTLTEDQKLKACFEKFTLSKQREFAEYIEEAKREGTKLKRLEKIIPLIRDGIGLNDKYR